MSIEYKNTCFFTGHRAIPLADKENICAKLSEICINLITNYGVTDFVAGGALGFDTLAAIEILRLKSKYPHISLHIYIPCKNQTAKWKPKDVDVYNYIKENADSVVYITDSDYLPGCMQMRNRAMVNDAFFGIAYCTNTTSGTYNTVKYAREKGRNVFVID